MDNNVLIRSGEAQLVGWSRYMLYSGFNILPHSVFWSANFNGRSDNTDVVRAFRIDRFSETLGRSHAHLRNCTRIDKLLKSIFRFCDIMSHITRLCATSFLRLSCESHWRRLRFASQFHEIFTPILAARYFLDRDMSCSDTS